MLRALLSSLLLYLLLCTCDRAQTAEPELTVPQWQKIELNFVGPATGENDGVNPFRDYRLDVNFLYKDSVIVIPGFYAADGNAATTGADTGSVWRVRFRPPTVGTWTYEAVLRRGKDVATDGSQLTGERIELANQRGTIAVTAPADGETGRLVRRHPRYLQWANTGKYFLKGGANSPENFLAYEDFDGTYRHSADFREGESTVDSLHRYAPHLRDHRPGDPTWQNGKGKGIIGALNYLAGAGGNSVYFLTMNIGGDGKDVFPYANHADRTRFDCSKLDQWEIVFDHADDALGLMLHFVLQETENETLLDGGDTGLERKLYVRELVARFGHHRAVTWNLGEENGPNDWSKDYGWQTTEQVAAFAEFVHATDPYHNYLVVHTHSVPENLREIMDQHLGNDAFGGISLQLHEPHLCHEETRYWIEKSDSAAVPWIATVDEFGPWFRGLDADGRTEMNNQDSIRALVLWGNLMAGGAGAEYYFGAFSQQNDLNTEDWRSHARAWRWTKNTLDFFRRRVPFAEMFGADELVTGEAYCLADDEGNYLVYLPFGEATDLSVTAGTYRVEPFDPASGDYPPAYDTSAGTRSISLVNPDGGDRAFLVTRVDANQ